MRTVCIFNKENAKATVGRLQDPSVSVVCKYAVTDLCMTRVCSYFDGDMPEEEKRKIEIKSEDEEEDVSLDQKKAHKSQR